MTAARIVKLVPIGQREDNFYEEIVVGGTDELASLTDFIGWHLQLFSGLTTDAAGLASVTLAHAPSAILSCFVLTSEAERVVRAHALVGSALTIEKRQLKYDKPATPIGAVSNPPAGVAIAAVIGMATDSTTQTGEAVSLNGAGAGNALRSGLAHTHAISSLYDHKHTLTFASTSLVIAALEATEVVVLYR